MIPEELVPAVAQYARVRRTTSARSPARDEAARELADAVLEHMESTPAGHGLTPAQEAMILATWRVYRHDQLLVERGVLSGPAVAYLAGRRDVRQRLQERGLANANGYLTEEGIKAGAAIADRLGMRAPSWNAQTMRVDL